MEQEDDIVNQILGDLDKYKLAHLDSTKIKEIKNNVLEELILSESELRLYRKLLTQYRYVDELDELRPGAYLRWFSLKKEKAHSLKLMRGGFMVDVKPTLNDILIVLKSGNKRHQCFSIKMNECILFQKNNRQEEVLIGILDQLREDE
jgi:ferredoxin-fold anticodon binding domain-containing protein